MKKTVSIILFIAVLAGVFFGCADPKFKLTITGTASDMLYEEPAKRYNAGDTVVIKTHIVMDADIECFLNGESIGIQTPIMTDGKYTHWEFTFVMPSEDSTLEIKTVGGKSG